MITKQDFHEGWKRLGALLFSLVMTTGFAAAAVAAPKCPDPPCKDSGGDEIMTLVDVYANWSGSGELADASPRFCTADGTLSNGYVGYPCDMNPRVNVGLGEPDRIEGQDADTLCPLLGNLLLGGDNGSIGDEYVGESRITAYHFTMDPTWNDGMCIGEDASCLVRVRITAYFDDWGEGKKRGRLVLFRGWGDAIPAGGNELNPFVNYQEIPIHYLEVHFMGIRNNREVALCEYGGLDENDRSGETGITWVADPD